MGKKERGLFKRPDSQNWYYCFQVNGRLYRGSTRTSNKSLAREIMNTKKADMLRGKAGIKNNASVRFPQLAERYLDATKDEKRSHGRDLISAKLLVAYLGNRKLVDIQENDVLIRGFIRARLSGSIEVCGKMSRPVARTTTNRDLALLRAMFNKGIQWGMCDKNPVKKGMIDTRAENEAKKYVFLTAHDVRAYLDACKPYYYPVALAAVLTGMRAGELKGLTWDRVDLRNNTIYLERTKGGKRREIRMPDELTKVLRKIESKKHSQFVFLNRHGKPYRDFREAHKGALGRSGIEADRLKQFASITDPAERHAVIKKNRITFHTLRHTFGTLLAKSCKDLNLVKKAMGHSSITTTERYAHIIEDAYRASVECFSEDLLHNNCTVVDFEAEAEKLDDDKMAVNKGSFVDTPKWRNW